MSNRVGVTEERLRSLAERGLETSELLEHAVSSLRPDLSPISFIASLKEAFHIPLFVLRDRVEGWIGLGLPGCDMPTADVVAVVEPFVTAFRERQGK